MFEDEVVLIVDRSWILYVLYVLIDNAHSYAARDTEIRVGWDLANNGSGALTVSTEGMPVENVEVVFSMFKRGEEAWRASEGGTGLGCWAAREHMRDLGGDLLVEVAGAMTAFTAVFPACCVKGIK